MSVAGNVAGAAVDGAVVDMPCSMVARTCSSDGVAAFEADGRGGIAALVSELVACAWG